MPLDDEQVAEADEAFQRWSEHNPFWTDPKLAFRAGFQYGREPAPLPSGVTSAPQNKASILCDIATEAIRRHPLGTDNPQMIIMLQEGNDGGIEFVGYRDTLDGLVDLVHHLIEALKAHNVRIGRIFKTADINRALFRDPVPPTSPLSSQNLPAGLRKGGT